MPMNNNVTESKSLKNILLSIFGDSVLIYAALLITAVMYHYNSSHTALYGIIAFFISAGLFKVFDFIAKHKYLGSLIYIVIFIIGMISVKYCVNIGELSYPVNFGIWFLTPQDVLEYSFWYTIAIYILMIGFFTSVVYYFTKVRYRIFMSFLIFIIPFAIYGKEYEKMPVYFIIILTMLYFVTMINCRQINLHDSGVKVVCKSGLWKTTFLFALVFSSVASIFPKPHIQEDRTILETMISANDFTEKLMKSISVFTKVSDSSKFREMTSKQILYYVKSNESLRLKTQTFTNYDFSTDKWNSGHNDTYYKSSPNADFDKNLPEALTEIAHAAELDEGFANKYGIKGVTTENIKYPEIERLKIYTAGLQADTVPVPTFYKHIYGSGGSKDIRATYSGVFFKESGYFNNNQNFELDYYKDNFLFGNEVKKILDCISYTQNYESILSDAADVLSNNDCMSDSLTLKELLSDYDNYDSFLDYDENLKIKELSEKITSGLYSDYEKAKEIEAYFYRNHYIYDLDYKKSDGDNVETFLFETHTGVCYEYATAMVLLARAAGIPARYAEGYNMSEIYKSDKYNTNYIIQQKDAHGFPELFIGGVGWVSFEPTVSDAATTTEHQNASTVYLYYAGILLILAGILIYIFVKLYPYIYQKIFMLRIEKAKPNKSAYMVMARIKSLYKIGNEKTALETAEIVADNKENACYTIASLFNKAAYGKDGITESEKMKIVVSYLNVYVKYRAKKKRKSKK